MILPSTWILGPHRTSSRTRSRCCGDRVVVVLVDAVVLWLLAGILDRFTLDGFGAAIGAALLIGVLNALVFPTLARLTLPLNVLTLGLAAIVLNAILVAFAIDLVPNAEIDRPRRGDRRHDRADALDVGDLGAARDRRRRELVPQRRRRRVARAARSSTARTSPASSSSRSTASPTRCWSARSPPAATPNIERWIDDGSHATAPLGDRLVLADRRLPGGAPARRQRRHAGLPLVGEGAQRPDRHQPPEGRGRDRAPPLQRPRPALRRRREPRQHPLRRRRPLDADDEHGADPAPPDRPRLRRLLRPSLRDLQDVQRGRRRVLPRALCGDPPEADATSSRGSTATASTGSSAPGRRSSSSTSRSRRSSATCSPAARSSTRRSSPTTRSPTTPGSSARTRSRCSRRSTARSAGSRRPTAEAPRPYRLIVLSDHGQSQGATFLQRYGYSLQELVEKACNSSSTYASSGDVGRGERLHGRRADRARPRPDAGHPRRSGGRREARRRPPRRRATEPTKAAPARSRPRSR